MPNLKENPRDRVLLANNSFVFFINKKRFIS